MKKTDTQLGHHFMLLLSYLYLSRIEKGASRPVIPKLAGNQIAPMRMRFAAFVIDMLFLYVISKGVHWTYTYGIFKFAGQEYFLTHFEMIFMAQNLLIVFLFALYFGLFESSKRQATPGKQLLRIKVCDAYGRPFGLYAAMLRFLLLALSITLVLGLLVAYFTPYRQTLHDFAFKSFVVF